MTLTPEKLDEIERGLQGVTPGPWYVEPRNRNRSFSVAFTPQLKVCQTYGDSVAAEAIGAHIARLDRKTVAELVRLARIGMAAERKAALDELAHLGQEADTIERLTRERDEALDRIRATTIAEAEQVAQLVKAGIADAEAFGLSVGIARLVRERDNSLQWVEDVKNVQENANAEGYAEARAHFEPRIAALEAENARLREALAMAVDAMHFYMLPSAMDGGIGECAAITNTKAALSTAREVLEEKGA